ncbi:MAG: hypothetical protein ACLSE6_08340 [Alphaproteobacteria bacterium]
MAFILSLTNNNDVNASIAPTDSINYIMLENALDSSTEQASVPTIYPEKSIDNIKSLYEMVTVKEKEKTIEKELTVSKGDTFISLLTGLGMEYNDAHSLYLKLKKVYDPANLKIGQKLAVTVIEDQETNQMLSLKHVITESGTPLHSGKERPERIYCQSGKDELIEEVNSASGTISGSLSVSINKAFPAKL